MDIQKLRADYLLNKYFHTPSFSHVDVSLFQTIVTIFLSALLVTFILFIIRKFFALKHAFTEQSILFELTPPAFTEKTSYTTQQLFATLHDLSKQKSFFNRLSGRKQLFSFEIVSTKTQGIRYVIRTNKLYANNFKHHLLSYLPQVRVKQIEDYLPSAKDNSNTKQYKIIELKLAKHFAYPLQKQNILEEHDPVAYITGMMTKLRPGELIALQLVVSPSNVPEKKKIKTMIYRGDAVLAYLDTFKLPTSLQVILTPVNVIINLTSAILSVFTGVTRTILNDFVDPRMASRQAQMQFQMQYAMQAAKSNIRPIRVLTPFEQQAVEAVEEKIEQKLFQTQIRLLTVMEDSDSTTEREQGFLSSLAMFTSMSDQALQRKLYINTSFVREYLYLLYRKRLLSLFSNTSHMLLSVSEISDLYHFPFASVTKTENIVKAHSKKLPAPLSLKNGRNLSVVFGNNTYAETITPIGLTEEERETHMYIIGRTGSGKTTLMFSMAKNDIEKGEGMAFIDPHGDVSEDLLTTIPENRKNDLIYFNPIDLKHPIGINLLELTPDLDEDEAELEKEVVAEGVISLFRKVFSKEENANAHRIEYILRNTIYTAFSTKDPTIFTLYDLLNNPPFQKEVIKHLTDENLKNFWKNEFGKAGSYQVVKMVGGVTAKIGRFLFSPTAKRILEQRKSTIDFNKIMDERKILLCNLSQGNLGEDTAKLLGTTIITKLQQASLRRARIAEKNRVPFYLYVDEFQNFATQSFTKMLSEARKYKLRVIIAEQSTSQQEEKNIVNKILANVTTVVVFRSANPIDEELMLAQLSPYVERGDIANLPRYNFYIKISALESEEPFSGETIKIQIKKDPERVEELIEVSRNNYASVYKRTRKIQKLISVEDETMKITTNDKQKDVGTESEVFPENRKRN